MEKSVIYVTGGDNRFLRFALFDSWKNICYWCTKPVDFTAIEIDHIIPKELGGSDLAELLHDFGLSDSYDLDAPSNLAPICRPCNGRGEKGNLLLISAPVVLTRCEKAGRLAEVVTNKVTKMRESPDRAEAFVLVSEMDIVDDESKALFEEYAPAIVQKLANLGEQTLDFLTPSGIVLNPELGRPYVDVLLNERGRTTRTLLDEVIKYPFDDVVRLAIADFLTRIEARLKSDLEDLSTPTRTHHTRIHILYNFPEYIILRDVSFKHLGPSIKFTLDGSYTSTCVADFSRLNDAGETQKKGIGTVTIESDWEASVTWSGTWGDEPQGVESRLVTESSTKRSLIWND